jgi:hypothetical protein
MPQIVRQFIYFPQWTPQTHASNCASIYLFPQWTLQTHASNCAYILFISSKNASDPFLKLWLHFIYFLHERPRHMPQIVRKFIYFLNKRPRHMPQIVPTFYLFLQWPLQTHASNCAYNLFISSMNAPDTCLKLCLQIIYFLNERSRDLPQIVCHFIYFLNERPIHMPQIVPTFYLFLPWTPQTHASNCTYILFISSMIASDPCLKLCLHFIYFLNERPRHMPQIVPTFYLFPQCAPQTHASNCAYILFISSMSAPDLCLKLCLHFIYFLNERFRPMPQIVPTFLLFISSMNTSDTCLIKLRIYFIYFLGTDMSDKENGHFHVFKPKITVHYLVLLEITRFATNRIGCYLSQPFVRKLYPLPDLPLCLGVFKHRAPLAREGPSSCQKKTFYDGFLLMWCNLTQCTYLT